MDGGGWEFVIAHISKIISVCKMALDIILGPLC